MQASMVWEPLGQAGATSVSMTASADEESIASPLDVLLDATSASLPTADELDLPKSHLLASSSDHTWGLDGFALVRAPFSLVILHRSRLAYSQARQAPPHCALKAGWRWM
jgi:hypothetical protein